MENKQKTENNAKNESKIGILEIIFGIMMMVGILLHKCDYTHKFFVPSSKSTSLVVPESNIATSSSAKSSSSHNTSISSNTSSSNSTSSDECIASGVYTINGQGWHSQLGAQQYYLPDRSVSVEFYKHYIKVDGIKCDYIDYAENLGGWTRYFAFTAYGMHTYYDVDANFNMRQILVSVNFGGGTTVYAMAKGTCTFDKVNPSVITSTSETTTTQKRESSAPTSYEWGCDWCHNSGKCRTCNGTHWYYPGLGSTTKVECPNCKPDGNCTHCGGSGKVTKIVR